MHRVVEALVEKNAKCAHWKGACDETPLHMACQGSDDGHIQTVKYLISKEADVNAQ